MTANNFVNRRWPFLKEMKKSEWMDHHKAFRDIRKNLIGFSNGTSIHLSLLDTIIPLILLRCLLSKESGTKLPGSDA